MNELIKLTSNRLDADLFTTSEIVAEYTGITYQVINRTIREQFPGLKRVGKGRVEFEVQHAVSGRIKEIYLLNEQQTMLLITFFKNTPRITNFKEALIKQFAAMTLELTRRQVMFEIGKKTSKDLNNAINNSDVDMHGHQYSTFNSLVYKQALGVSVAKLRKDRAVLKTDAITEYLSVDEASAVCKVKDQIIVLLELKMGYQQIKKVLQHQGIIYQIKLALPAISVSNS